MGFKKIIPTKFSFPHLSLAAGAVGPLSSTYQEILPHHTSRIEGVGALYRIGLMLIFLLTDLGTSF
jgi:hypothetical protein